MAKAMTSTLPTHLTKAVGVVEISEPAGELSLADRRLFNFLLANAYPSLGKHMSSGFRTSAVCGARA